MPFEIKGSLSGIDGILSLLDGLKQTMQAKLTRRATTKSARVIAGGVKAMLGGRGKYGSGLSARSIAVKVKTYSGGKVVAIIGPQKGKGKKVAVKDVFRVLRGGGRIVRLSKPKPEQLEQYRDPAKYFHLIERGATLKNGVHIPPQAPLRRGFEASKAQAEQTFRDDILAGLAELGM